MVSTGEFLLQMLQTKFALIAMDTSDIGHKLQLFYCISSVFDA